MKGQKGNEVFLEFTHNLPKNPLPIETIKACVDEFKRADIGNIQVAIHEHEDDVMRADEIADYIGITRAQVAVDMKHTETTNSAIREEFRSDVLVTPRGMIIHFPLMDPLQSDRFIIWGETSIFDARGNVIAVPRSRS